MRYSFGLCVIVSKIEQCRSSDPPYEIAINPWWRGGRGLPSLIALLQSVLSILILGISLLPILHIIIHIIKIIYHNTDILNNNLS